MKSREESTTVGSGLLISSVERRKDREVLVAFALLPLMLDNGWDTWFNYVIIFGELLVGIGLIVGGLTAIAAFFGMLMNFTFLYAGSVSSSPTFIILGVLIIIGWRVAGWWGLDRVLLPWLGTPGQPGRLRPQPVAATQGPAQRR
jgi:hypothetical protein